MTMTKEQMLATASSIIERWQNWEPENADVDEHAAHKDLDRQSTGLRAEIKRMLDSLPPEQTVEIRWGGADIDAALEDAVANKVAELLAEIYPHDEGRSALAAMELEQIEALLFREIGRAKVTGIRDGEAEEYIGAHGSLGLAIRLIDRLHRERWG
jgi:hypothetical protein